MASWLPETLFEIVGQGPAPSKDYYQLLVTRSQVIFRWWKISLRSEHRSAKPGEAKDTHEEFLENSHLQVQIALIFGARVLDYVFNLCEGKFDFLERLSDNLLLSIISYLDLEDIARLSQTSRRFAKLYIFVYESFPMTTFAIMEFKLTEGKMSEGSLSPVPVYYLTDGIT
ncbi:F-box only protein 36 isoform X3 [Felis catus]|uniref:F-box only protein 36 isoform X3 n=1 Tax=Felis catus TaxID=9685 RepID=UPI001D1A2E9A|nr:F-box only protein 36 isoform X3 [Felis catus]